MQRKILEKILLLVLSFRQLHHAVELTLVHYVNRKMFLPQWSVLKAIAWAVFAALMPRSIKRFDASQKILNQPILQFTVLS